MNFSSLEEALEPTSYQIVGELQQQQYRYSKILHQVGEKIQAYRATTTATIAIATATIAIATATATATTKAIATTIATTTATHSVIEYEIEYAKAQCELDYSK